MNGTHMQKAAKPPPTGPAPPVPKSTSSTATPTTTRPVTTNGSSAISSVPTKGKKRTEPTPVDPGVMLESLKSRIAALEEETNVGEEEERRIAEEARKSVKGVPDSAIHAKYIDLFQELKRIEREHAKEKQKLTREKDSMKSQLNKSNQSRTKIEATARALDKENKKLREDSKKLTFNLEEAQEGITHMKIEMDRRAERAKKKERKSHDSPDIVVKVVCKYRAELFFKISRKTKLSRLFNAWTERMESNASQEAGIPAPTLGSPPLMTFMFTHLGRGLEPDTTPEEAAMEEGDEILAVEMMDLTLTDAKPLPPQIQKLKKNWSDNPVESKRALEDLFDGVVRERLKDVLRQYELREKHFDCVIRSKELEVLLSKARAEEQRQLVDNERQLAITLEGQHTQLLQQIEEMQVAQAGLVDKLLNACKEFFSGDLDHPDMPTGPDRTQRLLAHLKEELDPKASSKETSVDGNVGG